MIEIRLQPSIPMAAINDRIVRTLALPTAEPPPDVWLPKLHRLLLNLVASAPSAEGACGHPKTREAPQPWRSTSV